MKKKGIIGVILALCLLLALASPALAGGLTVSGDKIETSVSTGNNYSYSMKVENTSDVPMDIMVEIKGYVCQPTGISLRSSQERIIRLLTSVNLVDKHMK